MRKLCSAALLLGVLLCAGAASAAMSVMEKDTIVVGTESTFKPFEFRNEKNEIVGFDMDLIALAAQKLGKKVEVVDMAFDALIPSLLSRKIDVAAAGMSVTPERASRIAFTVPYCVTLDAFTVKAGSSIKSVDDLQGKTLSVQLGTTQDLVVTKMAGVKEVRRYQKTDDAFREVLLGRVDAACVDATVTEETLANNKDFTEALTVAFTQPAADSGFALGVSKRDPEFLKALNAAMEEILASPAYVELKAKWGVK